MSNETAQIVEEKGFTEPTSQKMAPFLSKSNSPKETITTKLTIKDRFILAIATCGIGYAPLIPGTIASAAAALLYFSIALFETYLANILVENNYSKAKIFAWLNSINLLLFVAYSTLGIWAAGKATKILKNKDPKEVVVDEVIGQLITFMFISFTTSWKMILFGFVMFRLFDIFKPYPINYLQKLPSGIGVCADDILAGIYAGICLAFVHALMI